MLPPPHERKPKTKLSQLTFSAITLALFACFLRKTTLALVLQLSATLVDLQSEGFHNHFFC